MRIVHISATKAGGAGRAAWRLHEAMLAEGVESYFYSNDDYSKVLDNKKNGRQLYTPLPTKFFDRVRYKWRRLAVYNNSPQVKQQLVNLYKNQSSQFACEFAGLPFGCENLRLIPDLKKADAVILHWVNSTIDIDQFCEDFKDVPVIWTLHDMNPFQGIFHYREDEIRNKSIGGELDQRVRTLKKNAYSRKKNRMAISAPSAWLANEAEKSDLLGSYPVKCIPYSLDLTTYRIKDRQNIRSKLGLKPEEKVILFISDNVQNARKGFDLLLGALSGLSDPNIVLLALGADSGETKTNLKVKFVGKVSDDSLLSDYFNAADVFLLPSREDNLPNVMLESFACGCPVIGFSIGGVKEHVVNEKTGMLAKSVDEVSLKIAIQEFFNLQHRFSREVIRNYAEQKFNTSAQVAAYRQLIESL